MSSSLDVADRLIERRLRRDVVAVGVDAGLGHRAGELTGQRVELADALDLVAEQGDAPGAVLEVAGPDVDRIAAQAEGAALKGGVVAAVLQLHERAGEGVAGDAAAGLEADDHVAVGLDRADAVDAGDGGDDDDVAALEQGAGGAVPHAFDLFVDLTVFFDVGVGAGDVGFRLVVVVVADEVFDRVVGEELLHLAVELRGERLVGRQDQGRALGRLDHLGHGEGLARPGDAEQHEVAIAGADAGGQLADGLRLVAGGLVLRDDAQWTLHRLGRLLDRLEGDGQRRGFGFAGERGRHGANMVSPA